MPLKFSKNITSVLLSMVMLISGSSLAQSSSNADSLFSELDSSELSYQDKYPYFLQAEKVITLSTMSAGLIEKISAEPQDYVSKDQTLLKLDSDLIELEISALKDQIELHTTMEEAKIKLEYAKDNLKIVEDLYNQMIGDARVGSTKERKEAMQTRDLSLLGIKKAELEARTLKNQLTQKQKVLEYYSVKAPVDGVIVPFSNLKNLENTSIKEVQEGEIVQTAQPVLAMLKVDNLRLRFKLARNMLDQVSLGQKATVSVQGFEDPIEAKVVYIEPTIIEALDEFYVEVEIVNIAAKDNKGKYPFKYFPGMRAKVELN